MGLSPAEEVLDRGANAFGRLAGAFNPLSAESAQSFGEAFEADAELSGHRGGDAPGQILIERKIRVAGIAFENEVDADGVIIVFKKANHRVA